MTDKNVIKILMKRRGVNQAKLAALVGFKSQSNITGILNRRTGGMLVNNFIAMLDALDADMVIYDLTTKEPYKVCLEGMDIKTILKIIMFKKRMSQKWLAEQKKVSNGAISWFIRGEGKSMRMTNAMELCETMGCVISVYDRATGETYEIDTNDEGYLIVL